MWYLAFILGLTAGLSIACFVFGLGAAMALLGTGQPDHSDGWGNEL